MKILLLTAFICLTLNSCKEKKSEIYSDSSIAINGYDPVAYFTENRPVKGSSEYSIQWKGVNWLFSSRDNLNAFLSDPGKYEPQYGGYCAYGCSKGKKATTDPQAWTIVDGKLYLNNSLQVRAKWLMEQKQRIELADKYWPQIKNQ